MWGQRSLIASERAARYSAAQMGVTSQIVRALNVLGVSRWM
jgi:hypothetical protein